MVFVCFAVVSVPILSIRKGTRHLRNSFASLFSLVIQCIFFEVRGSGRKDIPMLRNKEIRTMVANDANFRKEFRELFRDIARLFEFRDRTNVYNSSPERILIRREMELTQLSKLIDRIVRLNRSSGERVLSGYIEDFDLISTKWNLIFEVYELVVDWIAEDKSAIRYFFVV